MWWKSSSENSLSDYIKSGGGKRILAVLLAAVLLLGAALITRTDGEPSALTSADGESLSELCSSVEGVGRCRVTLVYDSEGNAFAAAVICDGADDPRVRARLTDMLTTLLGIGSNRISILKFKE